MSPGARRSPLPAPGIPVGPASRPTRCRGPAPRPGASPCRACRRHAAMPPLRPGGDRAIDRQTPPATPATLPSPRRLANGGGATAAVPATEGVPRSLDGSGRTSREAYRSPAVRAGPFPTRRSRRGRTSTGRRSRSRRSCPASSRRSRSGRSGRRATSEPAGGPSSLRWDGRRDCSRPPRPPRLQVAGSPGARPTRPSRCHDARL